ncbi:MAG: PAS domain S-box protein [Actinobacteria bacterium]|nr:PAS domain S-box protein [Actinomycetota bacterium]
MTAPDRAGDGEHLLAIAEAVIDALISIDAAGIIQWVNGVTEQMFGWTRAELIGQNVGVLMPEPYQSRHDGYLRDYASSGEARIIGIGRELVGRRKDGSTFPLDLAVTESGTGAARRYFGLARDITERKRAEEERRRFFAVSPNLVCIVDGAGVFTDVNPSWTTRLGLLRDGLLGTSLLDRVHPDDRQATAAALASLVDGTGPARGAAGQTPVSFENRYLSWEGSYHWLLWNAVVGTPGDRLIYAVANDITERKRAEEELRLQACQLRGQAELLDLATDCIRVADLDGKITFWNAGGLALYGWSLGEVLGRRADEVLQTVHPEPVEVIREAILTAGSWAGELIQVRRDGREIVVASRYSLQETAAGEPIAIMAIDTDVTERRRAEDALRASEELHRSVIKALDEGVLILDRDGIVRHANARAEGILGLPVDEIVGRRPADPRWHLVDEDGRTTPPGSFPSVVTLRTCEPQREVVFGVRRPGRPLRWISTNCQPLCHSGGFGTMGAVVSFADVTDQLAVSRVKNEFVSIVSHELRAPLTSIRAALGLLASDERAPLPERSHHLLDTALSHTDQLIRLISDILDFQRIETGQVTLVMAEAPVSQLVGGTFELLLPIAAKTGVRLRADVGPVRAWCDADRIAQVLGNLVGNAIKFSQPGGTVRVAAHAGDAGDLVVSVSDDGRGIPADELDTVFERFRQVDAAGSPDEGGTGLGLTICRRIIEQHGGTIRAESVLGAGSTFTFTIPPRPGAA